MKLKRNQLFSSCFLNIVAVLLAALMVFSTLTTTVLAYGANQEVKHNTLGASEKSLDPSLQQEILGISGNMQKPTATLVAPPAEHAERRQLC